MEQQSYYEDYSHTLVEQEEMHFYSCVADVLDAFKTHGVDHVLKEIAKNPQLKQELREWLDKSV